eukprot:scpid51586/ scgid3649/ Fimbrin; ABP67
MADDSTVQCVASCNVLSRSGSGGKHSYSAAELYSFVEHVNRLLSSTDVPNVPIAEAKDLFDIQQDGALFCYLLNHVKTNAVNLSQLKRPATSKLAAIGNQNLVINGARTIGCKIENISAEDLYDKREYLVLAVLWQIVKASLFQRVTVKHHPELIRLAAPNEDLSEFLRLPAEGILLRWINYHLRNAGFVREVQNFSSDVADGHVYIHLLNQLLGQQCPLTLLEDLDALPRAHNIVRIATAQLNCKGLLSPQDIVQGVKTVNMAFVAFVFNTRPGLQLPSDSAMRRLSMDRDQLEQRVHMLDSQLQSERMNSSVVEELRTELQMSRSTCLQQTNNLDVLRRECADLRQALLTCKTEAMRVTTEHLPAVQRQLLGTEERHRRTETQLHEAEAAIKQMLEDNKVVQSQFALVVQERNRLRQGGDNSQRALQEKIDSLQTQLDVAVREKEKLQTAMEKTEEMVQHTQAVYELQAVHVSHLKILFACHQNAKSLAAAIYKDLSSDSLSKQPGTRSKSGLLNRVYNDKRGGEEVKVFYCFLKECFLFLYKPNKRSDPSEVLRVDDTLLDTTTVPGQYFLMISSLNDATPTPLTFRFDSGDELRTWHLALGTASEYWTGVKTLRQRRCQ